MKRLALLASMSLGLLACGDDGGGSDSENGTTSDDSVGGVCTPGVPVPCTCPDGSEGTRTCIGGTELGACQCDDGTSTTDPTTTSTSTTDGTSSTTDTTTTGDTETTGTTGDTDTTGSGPFCGDGNVDDDEQCDDENDNDNDACSNDCIASCGPERLDILDGIDGQGMAVTVDPDGDVVVAHALANGNFVVEQYQPDGTQNWSTTVDLTLDAVPVSITASGSDIIYVGGTYGTGAIFGHRLNGAGVEDPGANWPVTISPASGGVVAADSDDHLFLVGQANQNLGVSKYNADGTVFWQLTADVGGLVLPDIGRAVAVDGNDNLVIAVDIIDTDASHVRVRSYPPGTQGAAPSASWTTAQVIAEGKGVPVERTATGIAVDSANNVMVSISTADGAANTWDFFVAEFNNLGQPQWQQSGTALGFTESGRYIHGIASTAAGVIGLSGSIDDGGPAVLTVRLDTGGALLCRYSTQDAALGSAFSVTGPGTTTAGNLVVAGTESSDPTHPWLGVFRP